MTPCYNCSTSRGRKQWYSFPVDVKRSFYLDRIEVRDGKLTRMLCKDCASALNAQATTNPHKKEVRS